MWLGGSQNTMLCFIGELFDTLFCKYFVGSVLAGVFPTGQYFNAQRLTESRKSEFFEVEMADMTKILYHAV